jgi:hypothetical protein
MRELRALETHNPASKRENERPIMALRRSQSNIVNISFSISTEDGKAGVQISQAIINGVSAGVSFRTLNGARKSAAVNLDTAALLDLQTALTECLAEGEEG